MHHNGVALPLSQQHSTACTAQGDMLLASPLVRSWIPEQRASCLAAARAGGNSSCCHHPVAHGALHRYMIGVVVLSNWRGQPQWHFQSAVETADWGSVGWACGGFPLLVACTFVQVTFGVCVWVAIVPRAAFGYTDNSGAVAVWSLLLSPVRVCTTLPQCTCYWGWQLSPLCGAGAARLHVTFDGLSHRLSCIALRLSIESSKLRGMA